MNNIVIDSLSGSGFSIQVSGYYSKHGTANYFDSNWLIGYLLIATTKGVVKRKWNFLLIDELYQLLDWLQNTQQGLTPADLSFVDPSIRFKRITRCGIPFVKLIYETGNRRIMAEISLKNDTIEQCVNQLRQILRQFTREHLDNNIS